MLIICSKPPLFVQADYFVDMLLILKRLIFFLPLYSQNLEIKTDTAKSLADSLDQANSPIFPYLNTLLRILATRCMMQAVYFCSGMDNDFHHYGLASPIYTHFTSPIRRYFILMKLNRKELTHSLQVTHAHMH